MSTYPPTRLETWLTNLDGDHLGVIVIAVVVLVFVVCMVASIRARLAEPVTPARSRPTSSNRKAGRS